MRTLSAVPTTQSCVQIYLWIRDTSLYRTASWVPMVSSIERFYCIQDSQLGPNGVHYREVPLYTGQPAGPNGVLYREAPLYTEQPAGSQWCPLERSTVCQSRRFSYEFLRPLADIDLCSLNVSFFTAATLGYSPAAACSPWVS